jgi:hypothetical protein
VGWKLTVRVGPKVKRSRFGELGEVLQALELRAREIAGSAPGDALDARFKRFEPAERVLARLEIAGPERLVATVRAGVDVHGDGSVEAYRGRLRRRVIEPRRGESSYAALRRALS